ncbi:hypothetical protein EJ08DRAFT_703499 [Tothia fuscella]|uniref:Pleckstrin homology domain-containing protein n=1 Tax=Tothia fuscella TaxID=1048955 RepID=A0A9P4NE80_9PEZI|nr:hypothetical protein EJ08DRAFT_703499 [Tothia fuscella]
MSSRDYFSDLGGFGSGQAQSSPSETPFHTPRPSMSRRSSRPSTSRGGSSSPPPMPSSSPPPLPGSASTSRHDDSFHSGMKMQDEDDILIDPRRFTPTLHNSLVSEILNLRRELDSKHKFIEDLESNLKNARDERDEIAKQFSHADKDRRAVRRQFQQLEHGTLAALEELAKDRDGAKESNVDLRTKLETAQKKVKIQEDDSERRHAIWEKEKHSWESEKRGFERRVHITETRLKAVLVELAAHHAAVQLHEDGIEHEEEDNTRDSGVGDESDTASVQCSPARKATHHRSLSASSRRSINRIYRFSTQSIAGFDGNKGNGVSLADELQLDEEDEDYAELEEEEDDFPEHEMKARRAMESRQSHRDEKAKRILGIMPEDHLGTLQQQLEFDMRKSRDRDSTFHQQLLRFQGPIANYVDTAVQFSPPPSPVAAPVLQDLEKIPEPLVPLSDDQLEEDQRRKRVSAPPLVDRGQQMSPNPDSPPSSKMVSTASQTLEDPLSPPATPKIVSPPDSPTDSFHKVPELVSIATQTESFEEAEFPPTVFSDLKRAPAPAPLPIPAIAIHPPGSAPPSPREALLPPGTKNISCQTGPDLLEMKSVSVQTEEIRTDQRLWRLPPHLLPSFISSSPPTPENGKQRTASERSPLAWSAGQDSPPPQDIPSSPPQMPSPTLVEQRYPGNNDNGPVGGDGPRRPFRNSSLFAGFDEGDDEVDRIEGDSKPASYQTPSASRSLKHMRHFGSTVSPVPEDKEVESKPRASESSDAAYSRSNSASGRTSLERQSFEGAGRGKLASLRSAGPSRQPSIRRSAMIQNGAAVHAQRSRTPSVGSVTSSQISNKSAGPPFPVPDRGSSRKLFPQSKSEGSQSPTPRGGGGLFCNRRGAPRQLTRKDSLRKVRSATVIHRSNSRNRNRSRSPPLNPLASNPISPSFPPLPKDHVLPPTKGYPFQRSGEKSLSISHPAGKPDVGKGSQGTVIDAIAATMVGEWMWKYVRRRKSFGVPETPQEVMGRPGTDGSVNVTGNGVRHKRWVWLSPYERAVMWSTKQPANNNALLGKSGRKLVIQSVLDVRDDTPLPKNHGISEPFNRSILILTPARALKFTAMSRERHYSWLTALSFLAHSPLLTPGLTNLPLPPEEPAEGDVRARGPSLQRAGIRDSVRIAKDKARPTPATRMWSGPASAGQRPSPTIHEYHGLEDRGNQPINDSAEAPTVPRFAHGRKRSATGPRLPSSSLRNFGYSQVPTPLFPSATSSEYGGTPSISAAGGSIYGGNSLIASARTSEASSSAVGRKNALEGVGTIRMEAFVEGRDGAVGRDSQDSNDVLGMDSSGRSSRRNNRFTGSGSDPRRSGMVYGDEFESFDPFCGF